MSHLSLTLLGSLAITLDDRSVTRLESDKVRGLLARLALEPAEALIHASENGFRAARALCRRAELLLWEGQTVQAEALFAETQRHPACEAHIRQRAGR